MPWHGLHRFVDIDSAGAASNAMATATVAMSIR